MRTNTFLVFVAAFAAVIPSTNAQIINGDFETPDTPTFTDIRAGENTIAPWVVGLDSVQLADVNNGFVFGPAFRGAQYLDLNGLGRGRLTQPSPPLPACSTHSPLPTPTTTTTPPLRRRPPFASSTAWEIG